MTKNDQPPEAPHPTRRRQTSLSRRKHDKALVNALRNIAIFLFLVNCIFGYWLLVNTNDVHDQQERLRSGICIQLENTTNAYDRELGLISSDPKSAHAHLISAIRLQRSIAFLQPLFECHPPIEIPKAPKTQLP